jgi:hypothetical protein
MVIVELLDMFRLCVQKWVGILFTPRLEFTPATMNMREGFDLRVCRLVDGSVLLHVPHGGRSGMFCCEVEMALGVHEDKTAKVRATEYAVWINAKGWRDWNQCTVTGRKRISIGDDKCMLYEKRRLSPWMVQMIKWRMQKHNDVDVLMRHYRNFHFMAVLNYLWDNIDRIPKGFVERWALRGPEALDQAWAEAETISPGLQEKKHTRILFDVLKEEAQSL